MRPTAGVGESLHNPRRRDAEGAIHEQVIRGLFVQSQRDTPAKLAGFAYAFEHLEIAPYHLLGRVAKRDGDRETSTLAEHIGEEERIAAGRIFGGFDTAVEASLRDLGVAVGAR